jgi:hypothetical protein
VVYDAPRTHSLPVDSVSNILFHPGADPIETKPDVAVGQRTLIPNSNGMSVVYGGVDGGLCIFGTLARPLSTHVGFHTGEITRVAVYTGLTGLYILIRFFLE